MGTSNLQRQTSLLLSTHLGQYRIRENIRPEWLDGLELDFYIEELRVGIEVQGRQHYEYTPYFHKTYGEYLAQKDRDRRKLDLCKHQGVSLHYISHQRDVLPLIETLISIHLPTVYHAKALEQQAAWEKSERKRKMIEATKLARRSISRKLTSIRKEKQREYLRPDFIEKKKRKIRATWSTLSETERQCVFETLGRPSELIIALS